MRRRAQPRSLTLTDLAEDIVLSIGSVFEQRAFGGLSIYDLISGPVGLDFHAVRDVVAFSSVSRSISTQRGIESLLQTTKRMIRNVMAVMCIDKRVPRTRLLREVLLAVPGAANMVLFPQEGNTALMAACASGCIDTARWLLIGGADPTIRNHLGKTARDVGGYKSGQCHDWKIETLLDGAATRSGLFGAAMQVAIRKGELDTLVTLLARPEIDVNWCDSHGSSLLHEACIGRGAFGQAPEAAAGREPREVRPLSAVRLLLEAGANADYAEPLYGDTALHYAAANGLLELIRELLLHGADQTLKDKEGRMPGDIAMARQQTEAAGMLSVSEVAVAVVS